MNTAPVVFEPIRFGITGPGYIHSMREGYFDDAQAYGLDAPSYIATGSLRSSFQPAESWRGPQHYIASTDMRRQW